MNSLWLHGWATDRQVFQGVTCHLKKNFRDLACSFDLPGFGSAAPLEEGETYSGQIISLLPLWGINEERIGIVGWSMGALVALEMAAQLKDKAGPVVLISGCACFTRSQDNRYGKDRRILELMSRRLDHEPETVLENFFSGMFSQSRQAYRESFSRRFWPGYRIQDIRALRQGLTYLSQADLRPLLGYIKSPVLLIHGADDPVIDFRLAEELSRALPGASLVKISEGDHIPFWGAEKYFADLIGDFLEKNAD
jgi:pimeloyl-[acyl-carrier protein] methyl ester esterase